MKKTVWATQYFATAVGNVVRPAPSSGSLNSGSDCDSGCDAGSDGEQQDVFGSHRLHPEDVSTSCELHVKLSIVVVLQRYARRRGDSSRRSSGSSVGSFAGTSPPPASEARAIPMAIHHSQTLPFDLRRRALEKALLATSAPSAGHASFRSRSSRRSVHFDISSVFERDDKLAQPYFPVTVKSTKEVAGFNEFADALLR